MRRCRLAALALAAALLAGPSACDFSGPRPGWVSAGCARTFGMRSRPDLARLDTAALTGGAAAGGTDMATLEHNGQPVLVLGYVGERDRARVAFFAWDGYEFRKESDIILSGTGAPAFSGDRSKAPAGVRNLNGFGAAEVLARTGGDCGDGSERLSVLSRDGRANWGLVFSACSRTTRSERSVLEMATDPSGNESVELVTYGPDETGGTGRIVRTLTLTWDGKAWRSVSAGEGLQAVSRDTGPAGQGSLSEKLKLKFPSLNRGVPTRGLVPGGLKMKPK